MTPSLKMRSLKGDPFMKLVMAFFVLVSASMAMADQKVDRCGGPSMIFIENGEASSLGGGKIEAKFLETKFLAKTVTKCKLESNDKEVIASSIVESADKFTLTMDGKSVDAWFLCQRGFSEVPEDDSCKDQ
jgi:hypothetical protein